MPHIKNNLLRELQYAYYLKNRPNGSKELLEADRLQYLGSTETLLKPSYTYADYASVMLASEIVAEQAKVDFPIFYCASDEFKFSMDEIPRTSENFLVIPIISSTDMSSHTEFYMEQPTFPDIKLESKFFEDKWEAFKGTPYVPTEPTGNLVTADVGTPENNTGIFYLLFPFFGAYMGDTDFKTTYYTRIDSFLKGHFNTGGSSPQVVELGKGFMGGTNEPRPLKTIAKVSLVENLMGSVGKILAYKTTELFSGGNDIYAYLRVSLTRPLQTDFDFNYSYVPVFDLNETIEVPTTLEELRDTFGMISDQYNQYTVKSTPRAVVNDVDVASLIGKIPAGQLETFIPIRFNTPTNVEDRYFTNFIIKDIVPRADVTLLNNNMLVSVSNLPEENYDLSKDGLFFQVEIFENGVSLHDHDVGSVNYQDLSGARAYTVEVTVTNVDIAQAVLKIAYGQPLSSAFIKSKRHILYHTSMIANNGYDYTNDLSMITTGKPNLFLEGTKVQKFSFPLRFKSTEDEITLVFRNDVNGIFNGKKGIGTHTGFTFRKV